MGKKSQMHIHHPLHPLYITCVYGDDSNNISENSSRHLQQHWWCPSLVYTKCPHSYQIAKQCKQPSLCPMYREWLPPNTTFITNQPVQPVEDFSRVEVFRCSEQRKHKCANNCREKRGAWMFLSPGSGVFYELGRVISFETHVDAAKACAIVCENYHCMGRIGEITTCLRNRGFDNVAFLRQRDSQCGRIATELVDLRGSGSVSDCRGNSTRFIGGVTCSDGCTVSSMASAQTRKQ